MSGNSLRASVIIPALDEAESLPRVLAELPFAADEAEVIVVDGGSTDRTVPIAQQAGARVVRETRRGYGRACAAGSAAAHAGVFIYMDADGSNLPTDSLRLLELIENGEADLVIGARQVDGLPRGVMPLQQRFGNWLAAALIGWLYGLRISELGPYRAVRRDVLAALDVREMTYGWPTEMLVKAARAGYRIREIPVSYRPRIGGRSKISGTLRGTVLAAWYILSITFRYVGWSAP